MKFICIIILLTTTVLSATRPLPFTGKVSIDGINFHGQAEFAFEILSENGNVLWAHSQNAMSDPISVSVLNGRYSVLLGGQGMSPIPSKLFLNSSNLFLKVHFDTGDGKGMRHLAPNVTISANAFSFAAEWAKYAEISYGVVPGAVSKEMLSIEVLRDFNKTLALDNGSITRDMLSEEVLNDLNKTIELDTGSITLEMLSNEVYSRLSDDDITNGLVAWWPFDGNASDMSGNDNHGIVNGATLTEDRFGNENSAYFFDGSAWIESGNLIPKFDQLTFSTWFLAKDSQGKLIQSILSIPRLPNGGGGSKLYFVNLSSPSIKAAVVSSTSYSIVSNSITFAKWHYGAFTTNGSKIKLYIDGNLIDSADYSFSISPSTQNLLIGKELHEDASEYGQREFNGYIDDVRVYNRALSDWEVRRVFSSINSNQENTYLLARSIESKHIKQGAISPLELNSTILKYLQPEITFQPQSLELLQGEPVNIAIQTEGRHLEFKWKKNGVELGNEENSSLIFQNSALTDEGNYTVTVTNDFGSVTSQIAKLDINSTWYLSGLIAWWPLDGNSSDMSGNGNHATIQGATPTVDRRGNTNSAYYLDGVDDYIEIQNLSFNANNEFTFSFWIKPDYNNASSNQYLFDIRSQSTIGHAAAMISNSNGNGRLRYGVHGTTNHSETTQALLPDNFTQICFVHDSNSDKLRIFFNGKTVFDTYQADFLPNSSNLRLGYRTVSLDGINFFKGTIDDFRAHSRALSEREATALYGLNNL